MRCSRSIENSCCQHQQRNAFQPSICLRVGRSQLSCSTNRLIAIPGYLRYRFQIVRGAFPNHVSPVSRLSGTPTEQLLFCNAAQPSPRTSGLSQNRHAITTLQSGHVNSRDMSTSCNLMVTRAQLPKLQYKCGTLCVVQVTVTTFSMRRPANNSFLSWPTQHTYTGRVGY